MLVAMAERPPEPTLRHLTRQQSDTEKNKKYPTLKEIFCQRIWHIWFFPTHKPTLQKTKRAKPTKTHPPPQTIFKTFSNFVTK